MHIPFLRPRSTKRRRPPGQLRRIMHRIQLAAMLLLFLLALGTLGFYLIADWPSFSDALYMTIITITTVGYGEIVPVHSLAARLFTGFISISGFGTLTFLFTSFTIFFLESDLDFSMRRRRMEKAIKQLSGHYIICGYGRVGRNVANELIATDRAYVAIEPDLPLMKEQADREPDLLWLQGDATDDELLQLAGIEQAAGVFAVSNDDAKNLMISLTAKQLNPKIRVVARCHEIRNVPKLKKAGADEVVVPDFTGGMKIVSLMVRPHVVSFLEEMRRSEHQVRMEEIRIPADFAARPLQALQLASPEYILVAVRLKKDWVFNPGQDFEITAGHTLVAMTTAEGRRLLEAQVSA